MKLLKGLVLTYMFIQSEVESEVEHEEIMVLYLYSSSE